MSSCSSNTVNLDNAQLVNIICRRGDTFSIEIDFLDPNGSPLDLTGYTWKMDVSAYDGAPTPVLNDTDFTYLGTSTGKLYVTATATVMLTIAAGQYVYGLQSTDTGIVKTWIYGTFTVNEDMVQ
jgi:hypothetical protein